MIFLDDVANKVKSAFFCEDFPLFFADVSLLAKNTTKTRKKKNVLMKREKKAFQFPLDV